MEPVKGQKHRELVARLAEDCGAGLSPGAQLFLKKIGVIDGVLDGKVEYERCLSLLETFSECASLQASPGATRGKAGPSARRRTIELQSEGERGTLEEGLRAHVVSRHIARSKSASPEVRKWREYLLGDPAAVVEPTRATALLQSPALRFLARDELSDLGVSIPKHTSTFTAGDLAKGHYGMVQEVQLEISWAGEHRTLQLQLTWPTGGLYSLRFWNDRDEMKELPVQPGSVLDHLRSNARDLAEQCFCSEAAAVSFIVRGDVPVQRAITVNTKVAAGQDYGEAAAINIIALPFVSPKSLAQAFSEVRRTLMGRHPRRPIDLSNLSLFDFVRTQEGSAGKRPSWPALTKTWDQLHKSDGDGYGGDYRRLRADYLRTERQVVFPGYLATTALPSVPSTETGRRLRRKHRRPR
jgi:hypothetical protein